MELYTHTSVQDQAIKLTHVLNLLARNKRLLEAYEQDSPEDGLSIRQYREQHDTYLAELERLMRPFGVSVPYLATD